MAISTRYENLGNPIEMGSVTLKNRIMKNGTTAWPSTSYSISAA